MIRSYRSIFPMLTALVIVPVLSLAGVCLYSTSDSDGDGWGWENGTTCRVANDNVVVPGNCVDDDGDGWGWNGSNSCPMDAPELEPEVQQKGIAAELARHRTVGLSTIRITASWAVQRGWADARNGTR